MHCCTGMDECYGETYPIASPMTDAIPQVLRPTQPSVIVPISSASSLPVSNVQSVQSEPDVRQILTGKIFVRDFLVQLKCCNVFI